jgi:hypothetical protein
LARRTASVTVPATIITPMMITAAFNARMD